MASESLLSDAHELAVQAFLRFSSLKRQQHVREVLVCLEDAAAGVRPAELYSSSDVHALLGGLRAELERCVGKEIENAYHSSALLVKHQMLQAQQAGVSLGVDTASLENEVLLREMRDAEADALTRPASDFAAKRGCLVGLGPGVRTVADPQLVQQRDQLASEVAALQARLAALMTSQAGAAAAADSQAAALQAASQQLADAQQQLQARGAEVNGLEEQLSAKLLGSSQFQQMRRLMQEKAQEVLALRRQLAKYEADIPSADAAFAAAAPVC